MKAIAFMSQKGGTGKTTLSVHLAVAAQERRERVAIIDTDPQQSATTWGDAREADTPIVATALTSELSQALRAARNDGMTLVVIDSAPHAAPAASAVAAAADLVVIPTRPSAFDIAACGRSVDIVKAAKRPFCIIVNASPYRAPEIAESIEVLKQYGAPVAPFTTVERRAYMRAVAHGLGVTEFEPEGKAAEEIRMLWLWLKRML